MNTDLVLRCPTCGSDAFADDEFCESCGLALGVLVATAVALGVLVTSSLLFGAGCYRFRRDIAHAWGGAVRSSRAAYAVLFEQHTSGLAALDRALTNRRHEASDALVVGQVGAHHEAVGRIDLEVEPPEGDRTRANVGFGSALAIAISYTNNHSILWAIIHGILGWLYVIYIALFG